MEKDTFYGTIGRSTLLEAVQGQSTPCYLYFPELIRQQVDRVRQCTGNAVDLHYAFKANPHPEILRLMASLGVGADVASGGELQRALEAGIPPHDIEFSGPGKRLEELRAAVAAAIGCINIEHVEEAGRIAAQARELNSVARVGIRVNTGSSGRRGGMRMAGDTQFGLSPDHLPAALQAIEAEGDVLQFVGLHAHVASQELDATVIGNNVCELCSVALSVAGMTSLPITKLNFGGGWGIDYFEGQDALNLDDLSQELAQIRRDPEYASVTNGTRLIFEPGRFLVGEAGVFAARVLYTKLGKSKNFVVVDGGLNSNYVLAGGMGQVIRRNFQLDVLSRQEDGGGDPLTFDVAGPLCTPQDVLATNVTSPSPPRPGDHIVFFNCGAYGPTASPVNFLSHPVPGEVFVDGVAPRA